MTTTAARPADGRSGPAAPIPAETLRWGTLLVVLTGTFMSILDVFIINVAVPSIQADLHAGPDAVQWVVAGFALAVGAGVITAGRLGDLYGRRRMYALGLGSFTLTSAACGFAPTSEALVVARVLQGGAAALMMPQVLAILGSVFAGPARVRAFTAYGLMMGVAAVFGQVIGGALIAADVLGSGWRGCFLVNVPVGVLALVLLPRLVPDAPSTGRARLDLVGVALVTIALVGTVLPLIQGQSRGWPPWTWASIVAAAAAFAALIGYERRLAARGRRPLIEPALFRERAFAAGLMAQLAFNCGLASYFLFLAVYVQQGLGLTALEAGELFCSIGGGYLVASLLAGRVSTRLGRQTVTVGALAMVLGLVALHESIALLPDTASHWWLAPALAIDGSGMGLVIAPLSMTVLSRVSTQHAGVASGMLSMVMQVGSALGVAVVGVVFYRVLQGSGGGPAGVAHAFDVSLYVLIATGMAVAALVQLIPKSDAARSKV